MALDSSNFDEISESDLQALIEAGTSEAISIEFKRAQYDRNDEGKREFLKDVSAFANASGGHLVIGIEEEKGSATRLSPIVAGNPDEEILRMENLLRDGLEPRVFGVRIKSVSVAGGIVFVIRVPKSWNPPHRVSAKGVNKFYLRSSASVNEASVEDLRNLFNSSSSALDKARAFRRGRLAKIFNLEGPILLAEDEGRLVVHIVPISAFSSSVQIEPRAMYTESVLLGLSPIGSAGHSDRFNFDGLLLYRGGEECFGYSQLFRSGIIEATKVGVLSQRRGEIVLMGITIETQVQKAVSSYLNVLKSLNVAPPFVIMITVEGTKSAVLLKSSASVLYGEAAPIVDSVLELPEIIIDDYRADGFYQDAFRPAFDAMWNAGGYAGSPNFD